MTIKGQGRVVLYARVSTEEQAKSGYSLAQQMEALRDYAARESYEVLKEITDPGQSGASLERPGMDRVRDLVAEGGVSVVLAQDRDRFAREPAFHYLLRREFEERGCLLRALNDRGDGSPEGELTDGILDQLAKFERAKIAERSRRGKLRKAQEGKIVAGHTPNFGFRYNASRDGYEVDEEKMARVRRVFRMVGVEGLPLYAVKRTFEHEGIPTPPTPKNPNGGQHWSKKTIRDMILNDVYRPHAFAEIEALLSGEVAARLDPEKSYGIWWFNRRRTTSKTVAESGLAGREYRKRQKTVEKPREEWIAVPVPDSGVPRAWVNTARAAIKDNRPTSSAGDRCWELSGGVIYCGGCGRRMAANRVLQPRTKKPAHYYRCPTRQQYGRGACLQSTHYRADKVEPEVWGLVTTLLAEPDRLRAGLEAMVAREREEVRGDPNREANGWLRKIAEADGKRARYQEMAVEDLITFGELRERLATLEDVRNLANRELEALRSRREKVAKLERDRDALLESYAGMASEALDKLTPEEHQRVYKMLKLRVVANLDGGIEVNGTLGAKPENDPPVCSLKTSSR